MAERLTKSERSRANAKFASIGEAITLLSEITQHDIDELVRREGITAEADGYSADKRPKIGASGASETTATEASALRGLPKDGDDDWTKHEMYDRQAKLISDAFQLINLIKRGSSRLRVNIEAIHHPGAGKKDKPNEIATETCKACHVTLEKYKNKFVSGYGPRCYQEYTFAKRMAAKNNMILDRVRWEYEYGLALDAGERPRCGDTVDQQIRKRRIRVDGHGGYQVEDIDGLVASGTLPRKTEVAS